MHHQKFDTKDLLTSNSGSYILKNLFLCDSYCFVYSLICKTQAHVYTRHARIDAYQPMYIEMYITPI